MLPFADRAEAGRLLAAKVKAYETNQDVVVVGLARGGVPVAFEVAEYLRAPLDVMVVRKLGVPWQPELAMGAVASGGVGILDHAMIRSLNLPKYYIHGLMAKEEKEIEKREALFRDGHPAQTLSGLAVILVDDGAATGSTMLAAAEAVRKLHPKEISIAVPVASRYAQGAFEAEVGKCISLATLEPLYAVGQWYKAFPQVADEEVKALLSGSRFYRKGREPVVHSSAAD